MQAHDQSFKNLILDYLRESLEFFARGPAGKLPPGAIITPLREERLRQWMGERGMIQDVVVKVEFPGGEREMLVFCIEHNSRESASILRRQAMYCIRASEDYDTTRIVPVAIFPHETGPVRKRFKLSVDGAVFMDFRCITVKLKDLEARCHITSGNVVARMCLPFMKFDAVRKFEVYASAYQGLKDLEQDRDKRSKYFGFLQQYANLQDEERQFRKEFVEDSSFKEEYMSTYDYAVREGRREGMEITAKAIVSLFSKGRVKAAAAREQLEEMVKAREISRGIANKALKQIVSK